MAKIIYKNLFTAADRPVEPAVFDLYEPPMQLEKCRRFEGEGRTLVELPDKRAYRAMNRSAQILAGAVLPAKEFIKVSPVCAEKSYSRYSWSESRGAR